MSERVQVVLVHCGWGSPSHWAGVEASLARSGISAVCADLPTMRVSTATLADDVEHVRSLIGGVPSVVCAHSYGGLVVTEAAAGATPVRHIVYVAAFVPKVGESLMDLVLRRPLPAVPPVFLDDGTTMVGEFVPDDGRYEPEALAMFAANPPRPFAAAGLGTPVSAVAGGEVASTYLLATRDTVIHPDTQREMAANADRIIEVDCDHMVPFVFPEQIAAAIVAAMESPEARG